MFPDLRTEAQKEADKQAEQAAIDSGRRDKEIYESYIATKAAERRQGSTSVN
jgi:hypothetical protein